MRKKKMGRRSALAWSVMAVLALLLPSLAGCATATPEVVETEVTRVVTEAVKETVVVKEVVTEVVTTTPVAESEIQPGGTVRIALWETTEIFNPHMRGGYTFQSYVAPILERLISFDADGNPVPVLAAEIPTLENGGLLQCLDDHPLVRTPGASSQY